MKQKYTVAAVLIVVIAAVVLLFMLKDSKPSTFELEDGNLVIGGSFGVTVPVTEISGLTLTETAPVITYKKNGSGVGTVYKGEFRLEGDVPARIYADTAKPPFVTFTHDGTAFYLNLATADETQALYQRILDAMD